jgi:hypothetical protein
MLLALLFAGPCIWSGPKEDPNAWKNEDNNLTAYLTMQTLVKEELVSPASAEFPWITDPNCVIVKDGFKYRITSRVDSQNSFGAMIRVRFSGVIEQVDKNKWMLRELDFKNW